MNKYRPDRWSSTGIFDRKTVYEPVSRITYLSSTFDPVAFRLKKNYRYETHLFFGAAMFREYRHLLVIRHESQGQMLEMEYLIRQFLADVPYKEPGIDESWDIKANAGADAKRYGVPRNEGPVGHGDVFHGESFRDKKRYQVDWSENESDVKRELVVHAEKGAGFSAAVARASKWFYNLAMNVVLLIAMLAVYVALWFHWEAVEKTVLTGLQGETAQRILHCGLLPDEVETAIRDTIQTFPDRNPTERMAWLFVLVSIPMLLVTLSLFFAIYYVLRWPFWVKWTLCIEKTDKGKPTVRCEWSNDRHRERSAKIEIEPFFKAIAATHRTNSAITGQGFGDFNPAWRAPLQVVVITSRRSFVIPVNDEEEQRELIRVMETFVEAVVGHPVSSPFP